MSSKILEKKREEGKAQQHDILLLQIRKIRDLKKEKSKLPFNNLTVIFIIVGVKFKKM